MSTLFRLDSSIRTEGSVSRAVADTFQDAWLAEHAEGTVTHRDLSLAPLPSEAWAIAAGAGYVPADQRTAEQNEAAALATTLGDELLGADALIVTSPLYNFGINQHLKAWVDLLITEPRFAPGGAPALAGKPAVLVVVRGGGYGEGTPRAGWDHGTPWIQRILRDVWGAELETIEAELTLAAVNPAMADLVGLADQSLASAKAAAAQHGKTLAERLRQAA
jgi:FMN-dependent NADH-azoreductase